MSAFLDRISGLFDKGLILAALFPLLIFASLVVALAAVILGGSAILRWFETVSASDTLALTTAFTVVLFLVSFFLRSLRRPILNGWSGAVTPPWFLDLERRRRGRLDATIADSRIWQGAQQIINDMRPVDLRQGIPNARADVLREHIERLHYPLQPITERELRQRYDRVCGALAAAYRHYTGSSLTRLRLRLIAFVRPRETEERLHLQTLVAQRALAFGPPGILKATRLGNVLAALDNYPYERYLMEGGVFWPHLEHRMKDNLFDDVQNQRILLDFLLALATLLALLPLLLAFLGPWLWLSWVWLAFISVAAVLSYLTYRLAIPAANSLSGALRAGCDLYRHDLLVALGVEAPETLIEERESWRKVSQLVVYGAPDNMDLRFRRPTPPETDW
jgi:hypothetical protein